MAATGSMRIPSMLNSPPALRRRVAWTLLLALGLAGSGIAHAGLPTGFVDQPVQSGLVNPVGITFLADGRALVAEYHVPDIRCVLPGGGFAPGDPAGSFSDIRINEFENGLLGMAIDPG